MAIERQLLYTLGSHNSDSIMDMRYALTDEGKAVDADALQRSGYVGPAPVTLADFVERVNMQKPTNERITVERVRSRSAASDRRKHCGTDRAGIELRPGDPALWTAGEWQNFIGHVFRQHFSAS